MMEKQQVIGLLNTINAAYPQFMRHLSQDERKAQLVLWYEMFQYDDIKVVADIVKRHIVLSKYPPTIAEIRQGIREKTMAEPTKLFKVLLAQARESMKSTNELVKVGMDGEADTYRARSLKQDAYDALPDELKVYVQSPDGLQDWFREWRFDHEAARKKFYSEIVALQENMDLQYVNTGVRNLSAIGLIGGI